jgi:squalene-associated FAD-dependent desaturase
MQATAIAGRPHVAVIGGGLAGLATAAGLVEQDVRVTLMESRPRLGGRASSIVDRETGQTIDNCQHVTMGCCTNFRHFSEKLGFADLLQPQRRLYFVAPPQPNQRPAVVPFTAGQLPVPLHLAMAFNRLPWFRFVEKRQIAFGLRALARPSTGPDEPFSHWLNRHKQSETVQRDFWHVVLVSALSESLDRISTQHARKVFVDGFLASRTGWQVSIPSVPLETIYSTRIRQWLDRQGIEVRLQAGVKQLCVEDGQVVRAEMRSGETVSADHFVLAVPHWLVKPILPDDLADDSHFSGIGRLETAPIASVHLWFDRPLTSLPHATLLNRLSQWMFNRGLVQQDEKGSESAATSHVQVVISAARNLSGLSEADIIGQVESELRSVWPDSHEAKLQHARLITEHRAVFSPLPDVDALRPSQQTPVTNLQLAGDWTSTGWPSTMEGAVRSGYLAAENILRHLNRPVELIQPDLPQSRLFRWCFRVT